MKTNPVTLKIRFKDLFTPEMPHRLRRDRWEEWKQLASKEARLYWSENNGACDGCKYVDGGWCELQGLPKTVNPVLTFQFGMLGMACMGAGYIPKDGQLTIDFHDPF